MLTPPLTDLTALLGIDLVLCVGCMWLLGGRRSVSKLAKLATALCFVGLWLPVGAAHLPLLAYVRGISSDLSVTLVALAGMGLWRRLLELRLIVRREKTALYGAIAVAALFLYPTALGWGDWDVYRSGWGSWGLWTALLALSLLAWVNGFRLLPLLVGLGLIAWCAGLMESSNLWDYLVDPWLAAAALLQCLNSGTKRVFAQFRPPGSNAGNLSH